MVLVDDTFVDGRIKTKLFGVIVQRLEASWWEFSATETQIKKLKSALAAAPDNVPKSK